MKRNIITIDESKCDGCGDCVTGCHEGALQLINGKAVLVDELFCDGLGACIGECHNNAISVENREAMPYNEIEVISRLVKKGKEVVFAHLKHLTDHGQQTLHNEAIAYLRGIGYADINIGKTPKPLFNVVYNNSNKKTESIKSAGDNGSDVSELENWPIQLHLANPFNRDFQNSDILLAADCTSFSVKDFQGKHLTGKKLLIACPKLDSNKEIYIDKLSTLIEHTQISSLTIAIMEVPCCSGLFKIAEIAAANSSRKIPVSILKFSIKGQMLEAKVIEMVSSN